MPRSRPTLVSLAIVLAGAIPTTAMSDPPLPTCWRLSPTTACETSSHGLGVLCGSVICAHKILVNEEILRATPTSGAGRTSFGSATSAGLCHLVVFDCSPSGCVNTGVVYNVYHFSEVLTGSACTGS
jgi:hypothetical protein